jgi:hypothetical protein
MKRETTKKKTTQRRCTVKFSATNTHRGSKRKSKRVRHQQIASAPPKAHLSTDRVSALKRFYDLRYFKKHNPTWKYHLTTPRKVRWLPNVRTQPVSPKLTNSVEYQLKELLVSHWGDSRLRPELTPTFSVAEILAKHNLFQHAPFLHFSRVMEFWKLYGGSLCEMMQPTSIEKMGKSSPNLCLRYRFIGNVSPDQVMLRLRHVWQNHQLQSAKQATDRVDILLDMLPDARTESGTIDGDTTRFHTICLPDDLSVLHQQIKHRYSLYNAINKNNRLTSCRGSAASKVLVMMHISVAHQLLDNNGAFCMDMDVGSTFSMHTLMLLRSMFKQVSVYHTYMQPPTKTEVFLWCGGFVGYTDSLHTRLQSCIDQLQNIQDGATDVAFLDANEALCGSVYNDIRQKNAPFAKYAYEYAQCYLACTDRDVDRASSFGRFVTAAQYDIGRQLVQDVYKIPLPLHHPPNDNNQLSKSPDAHICLVNIPGSGMQAIIDMLFDKCHKARSTKQRMVFTSTADANGTRTCVVEAYPYTTATEYSEFALKMVLCCHPCERASRSLAMVRNALPDAHEAPLAKLLRECHIDELTDLFCNTTESFPELTHNKVFCSQIDYLSSSFQLPVCTNTDIYRKPADLIRCLEEMLQVHLPVPPEDKHTLAPLRVHHSVQQHIERVYHRDYLFLRFPTTSDTVARVNDIHLFHAHIPYHPTDSRTKKTSVHHYVNLKRAPNGFLLPPLAEKVFNLPHADKTRVSVSVYYFVHIAKTGGVSIRHALRDIADPLNSMRDPPQNMLLPSPQKGCYTRVLSRGHLRARDIDPRIRTFAVLREPLARIRSAFQFISEKGTHSEVWGKSNYTIQELHRVFVQHRIRTISDIFTLPNRPVRERILNHEHFRCMCEYVCDARGTLIVDHLFLLETLQPTVLSAHLNIRHIQLSHENASRRKYALTTEDMGHIRRHYARDIALYNTVVKKEGNRSGYGMAKPRERCVF